MKVETYGNLVYADDKLVIGSLACAEIINGARMIAEREFSACESEGKTAFRSLSDLRSKLLARSETAYCDMIRVARLNESLGWESKVARREFGRKELDAHCSAAELLGRHRALAEVCREMEEILKVNAESEPRRDAETMAKEYKKRHKELHEKLDELIADWIGATKADCSQFQVGG